ILNPSTQRRRLDCLDLDSFVWVEVFPAAPFRERRVVGIAAVGFVAFQAHALDVLRQDGQAQDLDVQVGPIAGEPLYERPRDGKSGRVPVPEVDDLDGLAESPPLLNAAPGQRLAGLPSARVETDA